MSTRAPTDERHERRRSFERLYRRHHGELLRFLTRDLRSREDAEDVAQTAFANAYRAYVEGDPPSEPRAWLFAIARNANRRRFRRGAVTEVPLEEHTAAQADPARDVDEIREALAEIPFNQRAALVLREVGGLSYDEIARELAVTPAAVQMLVFRARKTLRRELEPPRFARVRALVTVPLARLSSLFESGGSAAGVATAARAAGVLGAVALGTGIVAGTGAVPLPGSLRDEAPDARATAAPPASLRAGASSMSAGGARPSAAAEPGARTRRRARGSERPAAPRPARAPAAGGTVAAGPALAPARAGMPTVAAAAPAIPLAVPTPAVSVPALPQPALPVAKAPVAQPARPSVPALPKPPSQEALSPPTLPVPTPAVPAVSPPELPSVPELP